MNLRERASQCDACGLCKTAQYVGLIGTGPEPCDAMIVGEAPGKREDDSGKPFVGQSGKLLDEVLTAAGILRDDVFITNAVHCRPPENRTPKKGEITKCKHWLDEEIKLVKPKFILLLGNVPLISITGKGGIKKRRGKPFTKDGIWYLATYHPSFILRDARFRGQFEMDIAFFADIVKHGGIPKSDGLKPIIVRDDNSFFQMLEDIKRDGEASFDIETTCLYPWQREHISVDEKGKRVHYPEAEINSIGFGTKRAQWILVPSFERVVLLDQFLRRYKIKLTMQNGKFDCLWMWVHFDVQWQPYLDFDTMLAHYLIDENDLHDLKYLARQYFGAHDWDIDIETKSGPLTEESAAYQAGDLYYTRKLKSVLQRKLEKDSGIQLVFDKILMPCARLFVEIEYDGLFIDLDKMGAASQYLKNEMRTAQVEMKKHADINFSSPKQLAKFLFEDLSIPVVERTKKGAASVNESVLKRIDHPVVESILKFRGAKQQHSFFIKGWAPFLDGHWLHPSFKLHGTVTGRLSSEHPNSQQIPRDERIRSLITAPKGWTLVECDLSQIELRIAAMLAHEHTMLEYFNSGRDTHWEVALAEIERGGGYAELVVATASKIAGKKIRYHAAFDILRRAGGDVCASIDKVWKELRKKAKAVNFGFLYGMWWKKFKIYARDNYGVVVTDEEAQASRKNFFDTFSDFPAWHNRQRRFARTHGYVRSLSGRKRRLPDAMAAEDSPARGEAERQAINSPVQSFANELNLMAALQLRKEYGRDKVRICATIHDAILVRVKNKYVAKVTRRLLEIMSHPDLLDDFDIKLTVPVTAEAKIGSWGSGVSLDKWLVTQAT